AAHVGGQDAIRASFHALGLRSLRRLLHPPILMLPSSRPEPSAGMTVSDVSIFGWWRVARMGQLGGAPPPSEPAQVPPKNQWVCLCPPPRVCSARRRTSNAGIPGREDRRRRHGGRPCLG